MNRIPNAFVLIAFSLIAVASTNAADDVRFNGREQATLTRTNGFRIDGILLELNANRVRIQSKGRNSPLVLKSSDVNVVKTRSDTYTFDPTSQQFLSKRMSDEETRQVAERARQDAERIQREAEAKEAKISGPLTFQNNTDREAIIILNSYKNVQGNDVTLSHSTLDPTLSGLTPAEYFVIMPHKSVDVQSFEAKAALAKLEVIIAIPLAFRTDKRTNQELQKELDALRAGVPLVTSAVSYSLQILHSRTTHQLQNPTPGKPFVVKIATENVPALLPIEVGVWKLSQNVSRRKAFVSTNIGGGSIKTEEVNPIEDWGRYATATATVKNITDRAIEVTATLEFDFGIDDYGVKSFREFTKTFTIDARKSSDVSITGDCQTGLFPSNTQVERVAVRNIVCR